MMDFDEHDERKNKNAFCTYEEIDNRQVLELVGLLERWEAGEIEPWDVLLQADIITGAHSPFLIGYHVSLGYVPGTSNFERTLADALRDIPKRAAEIGERNLRQVKGTKEWIGRLKDMESDKAPDVIDRVGAEQRERLERLRASTPGGLPDLTQEEGFQGPAGYLEALGELFAVRREAAQENNVLIQAIADAAIALVHHEKLEAEHEAANMDAGLQRVTEEAWAKHQKHIDGITAQFRPEVMEKTPVVAENIRMIREQIEDGNFDSWQTATAIAEVLFVPDPEEPEERPRYRLPWEREEKTHLSAFKEEIGKEKANCEARKPDMERTVDLFHPETEAEIKGSLARAFARADARREEKAERDQSRERFGLLSDLFALVEHTGLNEEEGRTSGPDPEEPEFVSCRISPSATACTLRRSARG